MTQRERPIDAGTLRWSFVLALVDVALWVVAVALARRAVWVGVSLLVWSAVSLACVIGLYVWAAFGANPGAWMKGTRAPWLQPLFVPFRVVAWCVLLASRVVRGRHPPVSRVLPDLAVGIRLFDFEVPQALDGLAAVLDLASEMPTSRTRRARLGLPVLDRCAPTLAEIDQGARWACERIAAGEGVYIHCAFGRGRSAMMTAAVLLRLGRATTAHEALALVRAARPAVRVKGSQWRALGDYAAWLATHPREARDDLGPAPSR